MRLKTVDKLMLRSYLGPMVLAFAIVMFVLLMNFLWKFIDELVGKGVPADVIAELFGYAMITLVPMGLPLATLFAAIMTMGSLGENYELLAMKSAGMSLMRILRPVLVVVGLIAVASFFVSNNLVPISYARMSALRYDVRRQKQNIEFQDGIFFNGVDGLTIRVEHQRPEDKLLRGIIIYDNTDPDRKRVMKTTLADSGYIKLSDDKQNLLVTLYNGAMYETNRQPAQGEWYEKSTLTTSRFARQYMATSLTGFAMERTDASMFNGGMTKNIVRLQHEIDSLTLQVDTLVTKSYAPLFKEAVFRNDPALMVDSLRAVSARVNPVYVMDSIATLDLPARQRLWRAALNTGQSARAMFDWDEEQLKTTLNELYSYKASWHEKVVLPFSIMIFFLIGAALGAIIRKGGLGMPVVVSVVFFVIYYVISIMGSKMAKEGTVASFTGMWMPAFVLLPIAAFLTFKATNDSNLFNPEWYIYRWRAIKKMIIRK